MTADEKIQRFVELLERWNRSINLTAASSRAEIAEHVADSRPVVALLRGCKRVLDVGAGGGFPSVIVAIELPDVVLVALEPIHKKHAFLRTVARELALTNLDPRAERLDDHPARDYDAAMSRATFDLREWLDAGRSHVRPGGIVIGFEATRRDDLPPTIERHEYRVGDKLRALVTLRA